MQQWPKKKIKRVENVPKASSPCRWRSGSAAWSGVLALSGFRYDAATAAVTATPRTSNGSFHCFWSSATGWGTFTVTPTRFQVKVLHGRLAVKWCEIPLRLAGNSKVLINGKAVPNKLTGSVLEFSNVQVLSEGDELEAS